MDISFENQFHTLTRYENIGNRAKYDQFLNWLKGEFDLYLMEELDGLKVYFPNGLFSVVLFSENEKDFSVEIKIKSKTLKTTSLISSKIENVYNHLNRVFATITPNDEVQSN